jgi:hypothetical protein
MRPFALTAADPQGGPAVKRAYRVDETLDRIKEVIPLPVELAGSPR